MTNNSILKNIILVLLAMFLSVTIQINLDSSVELTRSFQVDEIYSIIVFILYYIMINKIFNREGKKREKVISFVMATVFAGIEIIGFSIHNYNNLEGIIGSKGVLLKATLKFVAYLGTFYGIILLIITNVLPKINNKSNEKEKRFFTDNKRSFFVYALFIFIAYIPYFLYNYPGIFTTDSIAEMHSAILNMGNLVNHHPVLHIFIISICLNIGKIFGNYTIGIAIYSILQMIATSAVFAYVIQYMASKKINAYIRIVTLAFFALYPPFAMYSITMWKDVPFALTMVLLTIQIVEMVTNNQYFNNKGNLARFAIISILVILFRNNGIYVVIITMIAIIIGIKENRKNVIVLTTGVILFYIVLKGPIFSMFNITNGPVREALSIPLQQIARTVKYKEEKLTQKEKDTIYKFLPVENLGEKYNPLISDSVKDNFNESEFKKNKSEFVALWIKLFLKFPKEYIEAFLSNSYGYWYPQAINLIIPDWYDYAEDELIQYEKSKLIQIPMMEKINNAINQRKIPLMSIIFSIGFTFWVILICICYTIYKKKYRHLLIYIPILALWLTTIASPVWCEYRYIYSMFTSIPLLTIVNINLLNRNKDQNE